MPSLRRRYYVGANRRQHLSFRASNSLYLSVRYAAQLKHWTVARLLEEAIKEYLSRFNRAAVAENTAALLQSAQAHIMKATALASGVHKLPMQAHKCKDIENRADRKELRQQLFNELMDAFSDVLKISKSERLAEESASRMECYRILVLLAGKAELVVDKAADERLFDEVKDLRGTHENLAKIAKQLQRKDAETGRAVRRDRETEN